MVGQKVLLLIGMNGEGRSNEEGYALLQYMGWSDPLDNIDKRLGCMRL